MVARAFALVLHALLLCHQPYHGAYYLHVQHEKVCTTESNVLDELGKQTLRK